MRLDLHRETAARKRQQRQKKYVREEKEEQQRQRHLEEQEIEHQEAEKKAIANDYAKLPVTSAALAITPTPVTFTYHSDSFFLNTFLSEA